jgi:hypothetical protein
MVNDLNNSRQYNNADNTGKKSDEINAHRSQENDTENEYDQDTLDKKERDEEGRILRWLVNMTPDEKNKNREEYNRIRWELADKLNARLAKRGLLLTNEDIKEWKIERYGQEYYDRVYGKVYG